MNQPGARFCFGCCWSSLLRGFFSSCSERGCPLGAEARLLPAAAPLGVRPGLEDTGSRALGHRLNRCEAGGSLLPDQGSSPCLLPWQADSLPPSHQGSLWSRLQSLGHCPLQQSFQLRPLEGGGLSGGLLSTPLQSHAHSSPASTQKTQAGGAAI